MSFIVFEYNLKSLPTYNVPWAVVWSSICLLVITVCVAMDAVHVKRMSTC